MRIIGGLPNPKSKRALTNVSMSGDFGISGFAPAVLASNSIRLGPAMVVRAEDILTFAIPMISLPKGG
jgi:hypothetical protein